MEIDLTGGRLPDIGLEEFGDRSDKFSRGGAAVQWVAGSGPCRHQVAGASGPRSTPVRSFTDAEKASVRNRSTGSFEGSIPSVTRMGSNTTMSPPCSRSVSMPVMSRLPTLTVLVLCHALDGSTVESPSAAIWIW